MYRYVSAALLIILFPLAAASQRGPAPVVVVEAKKVPFDDRIEALGTLRANESVELTTSVTESVTAIHFDDGQRVEKGYLLVEMTSAEEHAQLEEARSRQQEAKRQYERVRPLIKSGSAPASLADERKREYETANAQFRAVESKLADRLVKAPFDGVVGLRNISIGSLVSPGDTVATLDDDSIMKLDFSVPSTFLAELSTGMKIAAKAQAYKGREFNGVVSSIDSRVDPVTRSILIRARIPNDSMLLKPGMLMTVELIQNPRRALVIPEEALLKKGAENFVFVAADRNGALTAEKRSVEIGSRRPGELEIISGVSEGELVVTHGTMTVRPGGEVRIAGRQEGDEPLTSMIGSTKAAQ